MVASLSGTNCVDLRSIDEAAGVPSKEANTVSYSAAKWIFNVIREQKIEFDVKGIEIEEDITEREVRAIMDRILDLGDGDVVEGTCKAVETGVMDSPWSPNLNIKDKVLGLRDIYGACRYLEFGNLPFSNDIKDFHRAKVAEREKKEGKKADFHTTVRDLWTLSKGKIVGLPPYDK
jgi:methylaspartate mutase epsilon subunit